MLSILEQHPKGLFDPFWCNNKICTPDKAINSNGNKKCNIKNRFNVGSLTEKPPQSQITI